MPTLSRILLLFLTAALPLAGSVLAADEGPTRSEVDANRESIVAAALDLAPREAEAFWPLYRDYRKELDALEGRIAELVELYVAKQAPDAKISIYQVDEILDALPATEKEANAVRRKYLARFRKILPARKALRLFNVEYRLDAIVRFELTDGIAIPDGN